jgi:hypothetical protein
VRARAGLFGCKELHIKLKAADAEADSVDLVSCRPTLMLLHAGPRTEVYA